jgi:hypothetical protein
VVDAGAAERPLFYERNACADPGGGLARGEARRAASDHEQVVATLVEYCLSDISTGAARARYTWPLGGHSVGSFSLISRRRLALLQTPDAVIDIIDPLLPNAVPRELTLDDP